ncbi:MAG: class I SAM-dependent methyltransferase [bacterium]|nr:class I SAM-dependent methyltransferase [bacterium]
MTPARKNIRKVAQQYLEKNEPLGWFEAVYQSAKQNAAMIPWADMIPHPKLVEYLDRPHLSGEGKKALVIGCGIGDDAEELARKGFEVLAFDISESAIRWCRSRFTDSPVKYVTMDLFQAPASWNGHFDFVFESYTLQTLPPDLKNKAIQKAARLVAPGGSLLVICRGRDEEDKKAKIPWPLTRAEVKQFLQYDLTEVQFDDFMDREEPPVRRFQVEFLKK